MESARLTLVDPLGNRDTLFERDIVLSPMLRGGPNWRAGDGGSSLIDPERRAADAVAMLPMMATEIGDGLPRRVINRLRFGTHFYTQYAVPKSGPLGRYQVVLEFWREGEHRRSETHARDVFHVERLEIRDVARSTSGWVATVYNPSVAETPARVVEGVGSGQTARLEARHVVIGASATVRIPLQSTHAMLFYRDGQAFLPLCPGEPVLVIRAPQAGWEQNGDGHVRVTSPGEGTTRTLVGAARDVWLSVGVLAPRGAIRTPEVADEYDRLVALGLLREMPVGEG